MYCHSEFQQALSLIILTYVLIIEGGYQIIVEFLVLLYVYIDNNDT